MAWRQLLAQVAKRQLDHSYRLRAQPSINFYKGGTGSGLGNYHERWQSNYVGGFSRILRDTDGVSNVTLLKELYRSDPEMVIRLFESQPSLHSNPSALAEYVKALVTVDRLDESSLLKTLQREFGDAGGA